MRRAVAAALLVLTGCGPSERPAEPTDKPAPPPQSAPPFAPAADADDRPLTPAPETPKGPGR